MTRAAVLALAVALASPFAIQPAFAQTAQKPIAKPKTPRPPMGFRAAAVFENTAMTAETSFKVATGSASFFGFGGDAEVLSLWRRAFVRFGMSSASRSGNRQTLVGGELFEVPATLRIGLLTTEVSGGWRTYLKKRPRFAFYGGGGLIFQRFKQTSEFAEPTDDISDTSRGYVGFGGMEYQIRKRLVGGVEAQFRAVGDALGDTGLSASYNESSLGGFTIRGLVGFRFRK